MRRGTKVAFIGLGAMGFGMAASLCRAGFAVTGYDVRKQAVARLAQLVRGLPDGTLVAGAVRDEASRHLTEEAVAALRSLGVAGDLRGRYRDSHAFVGVKGAAPGTALEELGARAVEVTVGRPPATLGFELLAFALERAPARR